MTEEQIREEKLIRLEKNKQSAKQSRQKKKRIMEETENKIEFLEKIIASKKKGSDFLQLLKEKDDRAKNFRRSSFFPK